MNLNEYKPKYGQDQALFNYKYMEFANQLVNPTDDKDTVPNTPMVRPYSQQTSLTQDEDKEEEESYEPDSAAKLAPQKQISVSSTASMSPQEKMINISSCEFEEFQKYMIGQYGESQFSQGYDLIKQNRHLIY